MKAMSYALKHHFVLLAALALLVCLPLLVHAQSGSTSSAQLRAAIQIAVMKDPSSANVPPAQLNALIDALTAQAQKQGLTADQINYRPGEPVLGTAPAPSTCTTTFCEMANAFGFSSASGPILFILLILSGILIIIIGLMILRHHRVHPMQ